MGSSPKPRSGHRIVHHKGKIYSFGGFNPAVDGADPDLAEDAFWQDSKPLFKVGLVKSSLHPLKFPFSGTMGTKFDHQAMDEIPYEG